MKSKVATAEALSRAAAEKVDNGHKEARESALQAKIHATEDAVQCVLEAIQILGV